MTFFGLSERQAHRLLCSCMNGWSMESGATARKVHRLANPNIRARVMAWAAGLAVAGPLVFYMAA
jgi:hypothetical protein